MANELLISMGAGSDLEEFYPAIAINSLMRILKDQSLQQHHVMAVLVLLYLLQVWSTQGRISKDDWMESLRRLSVELPPPPLPHVVFEEVLGLFHKYNYVHVNH